MGRSHKPGEESHIWGAPLKVVENVASAIGCFSECPTTACPKACKPGPQVSPLALKGAWLCHTTHSWFHVLELLFPFVSTEEEKHEEISFSRRASQVSVGRDDYHTFTHYLIPVKMMIGS